MFDIGKEYWFNLILGEREVNIKGKVIEENQFMVKIETAKGDEIIPFVRIKNVNNAVK